MTNDKPPTMDEQIRKIIAARRERDRTLLELLTRSARKQGAASGTTDSEGAR